MFKKDTKLRYGKEKSFPKEAFYIVLIKYQANPKRKIPLIK